jgi:hypothetical protein
MLMARQLINERGFFFGVASGLNHNTHGAARPLFPFFEIHQKAEDLASFSFNCARPN